VIGKPAGAWRLVTALLAVAEPTGAGSALAVASIATGVVALSFTSVQAQTAWGVSRRTARRTTRRTSARQEAYYHGGSYYYGGAVGVPYLGVLPPNYQTVSVGGTTYYESDGVRYEAKIVEGQTVYVKVE
jgi:hypothetical protein